MKKQLKSETATQPKKTLKCMVCRKNKCDGTLISKRKKELRPLCVPCFDRFRETVERFVRSGISVKAGLYEELLEEFLRS